MYEPKVSAKRKLKTDGENTAVTQESAGTTKNPMVLPVDFEGYVVCLILIHIELNYSGTRR